MNINLKDAIAILERTPAVLDVWLRGLPEDWTTQNEGGETWSPYDVVGHLNHGELTDWIPRIRRVIDNGESKSFDPFDRFAQFKESEGKSLEELLDRFAALRKENLAALQALNLDDRSFAMKGMHQALGSVTLGELLAAWVAHDLTHIHQISRVMAHQYLDTVGPWRQYMGVMKGGHVSG